MVPPAQRADGAGAAGRGQELRGLGPQHDGAAARRAQRVQAGRGEGLVQEMAKNYVPNHSKLSLAIGISKPELISKEYKELNKTFHQSNLAYGVGGEKRVEVILKLYESIKGKSLLDYGCGKGYLAKTLPFPIWEYDPCIPGKDDSPSPADLVVCLDVLEHVEPEYLDFVLNDLARCVKQCGYFVIHTGPAQKILPDGRNTHLIQENKEWWRNKLIQHFILAENSIMERSLELHIVVAPRKNKNKLNKIKAA